MDAIARALLAVVALLATIWVVFAGPCSELQPDTSFPHCLQLDPAYALAWATDADNLWLAIDVDNPSPTGFAGIGISSAGGMKGADLVAVARQQDGSIAAQDLWSVAFQAPSLDRAQDVTLVSPLAAGQPPDTLSASNMTITEKEGRIRAIIRRPIHSCDSQDISITPGLPQHVVYSWGENWPSYHGSSQRGDLEINLIPKDGDKVVTVAPTGPLPNNTHTIDLTMPNITVPTNATSYLCTHIHLPDDRKYHIIAQEPLLSSPLLHHIIVYSCNRPRPATGDLYECQSMEAECTTFFLSWAPGQGYMEFPPVAGFPFGGGPAEEQIPSWFAMQVHYNNPNGVQSTTPDTSGLRITYTTDLRPNDMSVLTLTQLSLQLAPQKSLVVAPASLCPAGCTDSYLSQPVTMLYAFLHMHQTGATITARHIRGTTELAPLATRRVWDFNYQGLAPIPADTNELRPGDSLILQCTYNTLTRTNLTTFGEGTEDEMCFGFIMLYPRPKLQSCFVSPFTSKHALCSPSFLFPELDPALSVEQNYGKWIQEGIVINSTWSTYSRYQDPKCNGVAVEALA